MLAWAKPALEAYRQVEQLRERWDEKRINVAVLRHILAGVARWHIAASEAKHRAEAVGNVCEAARVAGRVRVKWGILGTLLSDIAHAEHAASPPPGISKLAEARDIYEKATGRVTLLRAALSGLRHAVQTEKSLRQKSEEAHDAYHDVEGDNCPICGSVLEAV